MLKHVVLFKFRDDCSDEQLQKIFDGMDALPDKIPQIQSYSHGPDAAIVDGKFDYGMVAEFNTSEDLLTYLEHPEHKAVGALVMAAIADAAQLQFYT